MDNNFHQEPEQLKTIILQMAALTQKALEKAVKAFSKRDIESANEVIQGDQEINRLEVEADMVSLRLLALDQPMTEDLRFIVGCKRIAVDIERIADLAVNVAERALILSGRPPLPPNQAMNMLAETAADMLDMVVAAFINQDTELAREVCRMDDTAGELNVAVLKNLLNYMVHEVPAVERAVQTIIAARCLEHVADHVTNIAESVIFIVQGINIRHICKN